MMVCWHALSQVGTYEEINQAYWNWAAISLEASTKWLRWSAANALRTYAPGAAVTAWSSNGTNSASAAAVLQGAGASAPRMVVENGLPHIDFVRSDAATYGYFSAPSVSLTLPKTIGTFEDAYCAFSIAMMVRMHTVVDSASRGGSNETILWCGADDGTELFSIGRLNSTNKLLVTWWDAGVTRPYYNVYMPEFTGGWDVVLISFKCYGGGCVTAQAHMDVCVHACTYACLHVCMPARLPCLWCVRALQRQTTSRPMPCGRPWPCMHANMQL